MSVDTEVLVVGGGPAGAALATRLATLGHDVTLAERCAFPRPHIGESLSPAIWPALDLLGAREHAEAAGCRHVALARVRWAGPEQRRMPPHAGLTVDRARFDAVLLERARAAGATVLQPASAARPLATDDGWRVTLRTADGPRTIAARFLADASGRQRVLGGRRRRTASAMLALHGVWRDVETVDGAETRIDAVRDAWLWGADLPGGGFRAMAFISPEFLRARRRLGRTREQIYRELISASPLFCDPRSRLAGGVEACDASCYADPDPIGPTLVKIGEAGFAIDPLSASGVHAAIQSAIAAATAVHTVLRPGGDAAAAIEYYGAHQHHTQAHHARLAAEAYRDIARVAPSPFWRRRAAPVATVPEPVGTPRLAGRTARLAPDTALVSTPCAVGASIVRRRALTHPRLERPVAFLDDIEVAPLIDVLANGRPVDELLRDWSSTIAPADALAVLDWLVRRGLVTSR